MEVEEAAIARNTPEPGTPPASIEQTGPPTQVGPNIGPPPEGVGNLNQLLLGLRGQSFATAQG